MESEPFIESEVFTYRGVRFKTKLFVTDGFQDSPFKDGTKTNCDLAIVNVNNGEALSYSLLVPLMIERYGFYEGEGTPYRVDPSKVIEMLTFLKPNDK